MLQLQQNSNGCCFFTRVDYTEDHDASRGKVAYVAEGGTLQNCVKGRGNSCQGARPHSSLPGGGVVLALVCPQLVEFQAHNLWN